MTYRLPDDAILALLIAADEARAERIARRPDAPGIDALRIMGVSAGAVPPEHMPPWMAHLIPALGEVLHRRHWAQFLDSLAWAGEAWRVLDEAAWDRVSLAFQTDAISHALEFAASRQPDPAPGYWRDIEPSVQAVLGALRGGGDICGLAEALECWSIPEGIDLWRREDVPEEAAWPAKCLADAAYGAGGPGEWTEAGMVEDITRADVCAGPLLSRTLFQRLAEEISAVKWG